MVRIAVEGGLELDAGSRQSAGGHQDIAEIEPLIRGGRGQGDGVALRLESVRRLAEGRQDAGEVGMQAGLLGSQVEGPPRTILRLRQFAAHHVGDREIARRGRIGRSQGDGPGDQVEAPLRLTALQQNRAEATERLGIRRLLAEYIFQNRRGFGQPTCGQMPGRNF